MNLDELQSAQARERQSSGLQHLRSSFYREVGEFIEKLTQKRARVVESTDDPFSEPEVRRLTDDIETAESTVEAIYERRVGKVVKKASIAAAGMPVEEDGLTSEEQALFDDLVTRIEENRDTVLSVLDGNSPTVSCSVDEDLGSEQNVDSTDSTTSVVAEEPSATDEPSATEGTTPRPGSNTDSGGVSAADLMGGEDSPTAESETESKTELVDSESPETKTSSAETPTEPPTEAPTATPPDTDSNSPTPSAPESTARQEEATESVQAANEQSAAPEPTKTSSEIPGLPRTTVKITADVGEIVGADDRDYDLGAEDVVTLPEPNADVLVNKNAAERL